MGRCPQPRVGPRLLTAIPLGDERADRQGVAQRSCPYTRPHKGRIAHARGAMARRSPEAGGTPEGPVVIVRRAEWTFCTQPAMRARHGGHRSKSAWLYGRTGVRGRKAVKQVNRVLLQTWATHFRVAVRGLRTETEPTPPAGCSLTCAPRRLLSSGRAALTAPVATGRSVDRVMSWTPGGDTMNHMAAVRL